MKDDGCSLWDRFFSERVAQALFLASVLFLLAVASVGWNCMLSPLYGFRQTQTAIAVTSLLNGGPWLAYETPVLGPPWSLPFEFPFYQWLVALVAKSGLSAVDQAGRFVSELFFFLSLLPLYKILGFLGTSPRQRYVILALLCLSPQYLFWSRSFMIESTALSLSLYFLWLVFLCRDALVARRRSPWLIAAAALVGSLAGVVKVTTLFSFMAAACLVLAGYAVSCYRKEGVTRERALPFSLVVCALVGVPFAAVLAWTAYSDGLKLLNPLAQGLTSANLKAWNFGTLEQRLSLKTWSVFYHRTLSDLAGNSLAVVASLLALLFCRRERALVGLVSLALFLLTLLTFTNLQFVHDYYCYANGIFLLVAVGVGVTGLMEQGSPLKRGAGTLLLALVLFCSVQHYFAGLWNLQKIDFDFSEITSAVNSHSGPDDVFIVFGSDWSSEIPYHIGRRAAMIKNADLNDPLLAGLKQNLKGQRIGGILFYTRNGFRAQEEQFVVQALQSFGITPGFNSIYPWYRNNSELLMVFNKGR